MTTDRISEQKYRLDTPENRAFLHRNTEALLSFGRRFPSPGGGAYYLGDDGTPWTDRPRETWITSRMVHVYSLGSLLGFPGSEGLADAGLKGLCGELKDSEHGGWYAGRTVSGGSLPGKECYAHAFVILAASSAVLCGRPGAESFLKEALAVYDRYFWDNREGLSCNSWNTEFTQCDSYRGLNANMHTVEAFLAAADTLSDETYRIRAGRIIARVLGWAEETSWRIPEHFNDRWEKDLNCNREKPDDPFRPYGATPGHGIEWARLIVQWALSSFRDSGSAAPYIQAACRLYDRAVLDAWNADGAPGLCYTTDWNGQPVVHDRMHWTLAEAINTSAVLFRVTGQERYRQDYAGFMRYLDACVLDRETGSWFHQLDRNNRPLDTVWPGKPDLYHALQAMLIPYCPDPALSVAAALRRGTCDRSGCSLPLS